MDSNSKHFNSKSNSTLHSSNTSKLWTRTVTSTIVQKVTAQFKYKQTVDSNRYNLLKSHFLVGTDRLSSTQSSVYAIQRTVNYIHSSRLRPELMIKPILLEIYKSATLRRKNVADRRSRDQPRFVIHRMLRIGGL